MIQTQPLTASVPSASAISLSNGTPANVTSLSLSAGAWLVWGFIDAALTGATLTSLIASLSLTSGALSSQAGSNVPASGARLLAEPIAQLLASLTTVSGVQSQDVGPTTLLVNPGQTATLYLCAQAGFSAGAVAVYGSLFGLALQLPQ
jgi:hypothetical protein